MSNTSSKTAKKSYFYAVGRRKTATARVRLYKSASVPGVEGAHQLVVNDISAEEYFPGEKNKKIYRAPFITAEALQKMSASVKVQGSGKNGQLGALVHGVARAFLVFDESLKPAMKAAGFLTRDARARERRKAGKGGKARRSKQSPKR